MQKHINGYSLALLDLAQEEKKLNKYKEQAIFLINILSKNIKYIKIIGSSNIERNKRIDLVKKTFKKNLDELLLNYILLLIEKNKINILIPSLKKLISYINKVNNVCEGFIYSVNKLTLREIKNIEIKITKNTGLNVNLANKLDTNLIAGIKVVVNDEIIDNSIKLQLKLLKQKLLEEEVD